MAENSNIYTKGVAVTPSDTTVYAARAIYVGGAGNVSVQMVPDGATVLFTAPPVGSILPIAAYRIMAATTATLLVALT